MAYVPSIPNASLKPFADVLEANSRWATSYHGGRLAPRAAKGLAVLTCMDSRIDPLGMLGLAPGDAKIFRNAGARVTDDVLRTLVVANYLLGVERFMIVAHTNCRMSESDETAIHDAIAAVGGPDTRSISFLATLDQAGALHADVQRVRSWPYLQKIAVGGFIFDLSNGVLTQVAF
jgi:carbonic anhydrase